MRIAVIWTLKEYVKRACTLLFGLSIVLSAARIADHKVSLSIEVFWTALPLAACFAAAWTAYSWRRESGDLVLSNGGISPWWVWGLLLTLSGVPFALRSAPDSTETEIHWQNHELSVRHAGVETTYLWTDSSVRRIHGDRVATVSDFPAPLGRSPSVADSLWVTMFMRVSALGILLGWQIRSIRPQGPLKTLAATGLCIAAGQLLPTLVS